MNLAPHMSDVFHTAISRFLEAAHQSAAAHKVVELLQSPHYAGDNRNEAVEKLAKDVESELGMTANLMFRSRGAVHDALQDLMDVYVDAVDSLADCNHKPE
jgi:hypothetical protein